MSLRLYGLEAQSLWLNELDSWWVSQHDDIRVVLGRLAIEDLHPPGYQLLLYLSIHTLGETEALLRLPSVITGVLAVWVTALLGRRLYDPFTGLLAAGLMAVFWAPLYYAQEARSYGTLMCAAVVTTYLALRLCQQEERGQAVSKWLPVCLTLSLIYTCYLHYFGLLAAGFVMFLLIYRLGPTRQVILIGVTVSVAYLPWLPSMWQDLQVTDHWITRPGITAAGGYLLFAFNRSLWLTLGLALPLIAWACLHALGGLRGANPMSPRWRRDPTVLLLLWLLLPIGVVVLKSLLSTPVITDRNLIICLPPLYLLMARGFYLLPLRGLPRSSLAVLLVAGVGAQLLWLQDYYSRPAKEDFRAAVAHVLERGPTINTRLLGSRRAYYYDYYLAQMGSERRIDLAVSSAEDHDRITRLLQDDSADRFWILEGYFFPAPQALRERLEADFEVLEQARFYRSRATLYGRQSPGRPSPLVTGPEGR